MKNLLSFLSYHNAVPAALVVLTLGAGGAFAASQGVLPLHGLSLSNVPARVVPPPTTDISAPEDVDASALLAANIDMFDFRPTVTGVVETDSLYTVSYSIETLAPEDGAWSPYMKTGDFTVAKDALDDTGLQGYAVAKLHDIKSGERSYLSRAQSAEKALANARQARPANAFAGLVGLALDQIFVPVVEKPTPTPQPDSAPAILPQSDVPMQTAQTTSEDSVTSTVLSASSPPQATSTEVSTGEATSTEPSGMATTTSAIATTSPASDVAPITNGSNATTTATTDTASTTPSQ